jgi:hypothetical protein
MHLRFDADFIVKLPRWEMLAKIDTKIAANRR